MFRTFLLIYLKVCPTINADFFPHAEQTNETYNRRNTNTDVKRSFKFDIRYFTAREKKNSATPTKTGESFTKNTHLRKRISNQLRYHKCLVDNLLCTKDSLLQSQLEQFVELRGQRLQHAADCKARIVADHSQNNLVGVEEHLMKKNIIIFKGEAYSLCRQNFTRSLVGFSQPDSTSLNQTYEEYRLQHIQKSYRQINLPAVVADAGEYAGGFWTLGSIICLFLNYSLKSYTGI